MATWFTSDLHFGHANIIEYCNRPFASVDEMNETLIGNWNERVQADDTVYVLGDFAMGRIADTLPLGLRLNGRKELIAGNHDRCWTDANPLSREWCRADEWVAKYRAAGFASICYGVGVHGVLDEDRRALFYAEFNHFPYKPTDDRFHSSHPRDDGHWLLHGHVHDAWRVNGRQINVGVDAWDYAPVSAEQIAAEIRASAERDEFYVGASWQP